MIGNYDKAGLVDNDIIDSFQLLAFKWEVYTNMVTKKYGSHLVRVIDDFRGIYRSKLLNLRGFPVFSRTDATI